LNKAHKILLLISILFFNTTNAEDINENVLKKINEESADILVENLNQHFIINFSKERQLCEKNLNLIIKDKSLLFLKESKSISKTMT
jgi:hypothetical protein